MTDLENCLVVGISTRALFDLAESNAVFESKGVEAYREHQRAREHETLSPGTGFPLVRGLLALNDPPPANSRVVVILLSRNDPDSSMRIYNSIEHYGLEIPRGAFRGGRDPWPFLPVFHCDLFLSAEPNAVLEAINGGTAAALVLGPPHPSEEEPSDPEVRIAFDGDAVLFGNASDVVWERDGPEAYRAHETKLADVPLDPGPFARFFKRLAWLQSELPPDRPGIRTALVTARGAPAHSRVINTLRSWNVRIDEAYFLGGLDKTETLWQLRPHMFFDDKLENLLRAADQVPAAHVLPRPILPSATEQLGAFHAADATRASGQRRRRSATPEIPAIKPLPRTPKPDLDASDEPLSPSTPEPSVAVDAAPEAMAPVAGRRKGPPRT